MSGAGARVGWGIAGSLVAAGALVLGYRLTHAPSDPAGRPRAADAALAELLPEADPAHGARLFQICAACHTIGQGAPDLSGPNLYGVLGAPVGEHRPRYGYTVALRSVGGRWDFERMDAWLKSPQRFAPGTRMVFSGLPSATDRADVIAYLNGQGSNLPLPARGSRP